jgi:membrane associated rhomboid family serine protease
MPRARYSYGGSTLTGSFPPGVKWLIAINVGVFLLCYLGGPLVQQPAAAYLALSAAGAIRYFLITQVFTYMFLHFGTMHVLFNMLGLWFFGVPIEQTWGTRRFVRFYLYCGLAAGICVLIVNVLTSDWATPTLGASGAIFGVLVAFGVLFPDTIILMFFLFPMKAKYAVMIYVAIELLVTLQSIHTGVSTVAHLGGAAFGYLFVKKQLPTLNLRLPDIGGAYRQWKLQRAKKKFQVYMKKHGGQGPWIN